MKKVSLEQLSPEIQGLFEDLRRHRLLITRNGLAFAVVADVGNKDEEDLDLEESPEFWRMIQERRRDPGPGLSLEEVEKDLFNGKDFTCHYSMLIQWSDEDNAFVVTLPEFGGCKTHGSTYLEAAQKGQEALELLMESCWNEGRPLPEPAKLGSSVPA